MSEGLDGRDEASIYRLGLAKVACEEDHLFFTRYFFKARQAITGLLDGRQAVYRRVVFAMGAERWVHEAGEDFHVGRRIFVLKQHIGVRKCAFTTICATVASGQVATPITT